jgi:hypothetical protein
LEHIRAEGRDLVDLVLSNPTRAGLDYPSDLLAPLSHPRGLTYDPHPRGLEEARRAVMDDYGRRGLSVPADRIVLTAGTSEAYSLLFRLFADPDDEVLVPRPSYPLFDYLTRFDHLTARTYDLEYQGAWSIDVGSVERALTPRTKALLAVSPNNPTGSYVKGGELGRLATLCASRGVLLIVDEVFADYELRPGAGADAGRVVECREGLVVSLGGLSKSAGLPQVKLGWMALAGSDDLIVWALEGLELICDTYLTVSTPVQAAASDLLARAAPVRAQIQQRVIRNYQMLVRRSMETPACRVLDAEGGWYAVIQVPTLGSEDDLVVDLANRHGVLAHPGYFFDFVRESYLIVSLLPAEPAFSEGVERIFRRFERIQAERT